MLDGYVHPNFAQVAHVLEKQLPRYGGAGAALAIFHRGEKVADLWGGSSRPDGTPWAEDTVAASFSTTKGVVSTLVHALVDQGRLDYEDPIAKHWPEFGSNGKEQITVRHALCHEAGLYRIGEMIDEAHLMTDWQYMTGALERARPAHPPGARHGYHALTYGWLLGGLIEAVTEQPFGDVLNELLVEPLALDGAFVGLPEAAMSRRALLTNGTLAEPRKREGWQAKVQLWVKEGMRLAGMDTDEFRAALNPFPEGLDWNAEAVVQAVIPAANGQFTARSLARIYAMIAEGGALGGARVFSEARVRALSTIQNRTRDQVLFLPMHWRLGYHRAFTFGARAPCAFGHYGYGGSGALCDLNRRLSVAYTTNFGAGTPTGDSRLARLAGAAMRAADRIV